MESAKRIDSPAPVALVAQLQDLHDASDASIAELFCALHPDNFRYIRDAEYWMYWNGFAWLPDVKYQELLNCLGQLRDSIRGLNSSAKTDIINQILNRLSGTRTKACAVTAISQLAKISTLSSDWDAHPHLIAFRNGVYNTDTGQIIRDPRAIRKLYLIKRLAATYSEDAPCSAWLEFLDTIFLGDQALIAFVQKLAGLSLCGNVQEELLIFAHGEGANGKTTFLNVLSKIFADYHVDIDPSILIKSRANDQRLKLENTANLRGKRLATANEIPELSSYDDGTVKQLSSRDPISYKQIYQSAGSFTPSHTLWVRANHKPRFNVNDGGMLRRLVLIPFAHHFPAQKRINRYEDTLIKEASGILNWLIQGWQEYRKNGLGEYPASVSVALDEYRQDCDLLGEFLRESYRPLADARQLMQSVLTKYNIWAGQNSYKTKNAKLLSNELRKAGYEIVKGHQNKSYILGLEELTDSDSPGF
jgi:putative DNA primase/helicase